MHDMTHVHPFSCLQQFFFFDFKLTKQLSHACVYTWAELRAPVKPACDCCHLFGDLSAFMREVEHVHSMHHISSMDTQKKHPDCWFQQGFFHEALAETPDFLTQHTRRPQPSPSRPGLETNFGRWLVEALRDV